MAPRFVNLIAACCVLLGFVGQLAAETKSSQFEQLINALDDEDVRIGASIALAKLGKDAVPALTKSLASDQPDRRIWSAYTLGEIGPAADSAVEDLTKSLGDTDGALRAAAAQALGKIGPASARAAVKLAELLTDNNADVRRQSAVALGQIGPPAESAVPRLIAALRDSQVREQARQSLIQIGKPAAQALVDSLNDDNLRFDVSTVLARVDPKTASQLGVAKPTLADLPSLEKVLLDPTRSPEERTAAATGLASLNKKGLEVLAEAFEEPEIAPTATSAFAGVGAEGVSVLLDKLTDKRPGVRAAAAEALGHIRPEAQQAVPHLVRLFEDDDHNVRYRAVRALDAFGQQAAPAVDELIAVVLDSSQREPMRQWAIMTLVNTLPGTHDRVVKALIKASQDKGNYGVKSLARLQLRKIDLKAAEAAGVR